jgi:hypothetical protein
MIGWDMSHAWNKVEVHVKFYSEIEDQLQDRDIIRENINLDVRVGVCTGVSRRTTVSSDGQLSTC